MAVTVLQPRARVREIVHYDLEPLLDVVGDGLQRIASIQIGEDACVPAAGSAAAEGALQRRFVCPGRYALNTSMPQRVTLHYERHEPGAESLPLQLRPARPLMAIGRGKNALLVIPSPNAYRWGLDLNDPLVSADSGIALQLTAQGAYKVVRASYTVEVKVADDPATEAAPLSAYLIPDFVHNELRTRRPLDFKKVLLPNILNPLLYRVVQQPSGLHSDWMPFPRTLVSLPQIGALECDATGAYLIHGSQLEQLDWVSNDVDLTLATSVTEGAMESPQFARLSACSDGLCLRIPSLAPGGHLKAKVHWIDDRLFDIQFPAPARCVTPVPGSAAAAGTY